MKITNFLATMLVCLVITFSTFADDGETNHGGRLPDFQCNSANQQCPVCDPSVWTCPSGNRSVNSGESGGESDEPGFFQLIWNYGLYIYRYR